MQAVAIFLSTPRWQHDSAACQSGEEGLGQALGPKLSNVSADDSLEDSALHRTPVIDAEAPHRLGNDAPAPRPPTDMYA
jgi:hypothetical protein